MAHEAGHGRFVWTELLTRDPERAASFYTDLFGWGTQVVPGPNGDYTMWIANGAPHGGMMKMPPEAKSPPCWLPYVSVDDVDAAAVRCEEEGGGIHVAPRDIPGMGRFAVLFDPFDAAFAVYRSERPEPAREGEAAPGEFSWRELATGDVALACDFYGEMFGWERGPQHDMGENGFYQLLVRGGGPPFGGVYKVAAPAPPSWTSYVRVADVERAAESATKHGGRVLVPPMVVPGGHRIAVCSDPEGAAIALHQLVPA